MTDTTNRIARLNDLARKAMGLACKAVQTAGISALPAELQSRIRERIETFSDFNEDNDPHGEHDFGAFDIEGHRVYWKIDYFDTNMQFLSEDPSDPIVTRRLLTILLAEEY